MREIRFWLHDIARGPGALTPVAFFVSSMLPALGLMLPLIGS